MFLTWEQICTAVFQGKAEKKLLFYIGQLS